MSERLAPRYPVFVLSKARARTCLTARFLLRDGVPFRLVVEPSEVEEYRAANPDADLLVAPRDGMGAPGVRNFIAETAVAERVDRHWQLDDNIVEVRRLYRGLRVPCHSGVALRVCEDFTDRYENVAVSGLQYQMFADPRKRPPPYYVNVHVYSCVLVDHRLPYRWRLPLNDDTDLCLQVLAAGYCTVVLNAFLANKLQTGLVPGGQGALYHGDGRLRMARTLERAWPYVVTTGRRFRRPQHFVRGAWRGFDTPLRRRTDIDWDALPSVDEYGLGLVQVADEVRSPAVRALLDERLGDRDAAP